jgi:hypothetical protein
MLMDLAGAEVRAASEMVPPCCGADLLRMGADCRRRGMELVIVMVGDFKFLYLTEIELEKMEEFRSLARASKHQLLRSEVLEFARRGDSAVVSVRFVSVERLGGLLAAARSHPVPLIGLPLMPIQGQDGMHLPACKSSLKEVQVGELLLPLDGHTPPNVLPRHRVACTPVVNRVAGVVCEI